MNDSNPAQRLLDRWTRWVMRHAVWVLLFSVFIAAFGIWRGSSHLRINQKLTALIPEDYPSVVRLDELRERIGSQTDFLVELRGQDREQVLAHGHRLTEQMRGLDNAFRYVEFQRDTQFFKDNALLYVPVSKLLDLRERVLKRIRKEVQSEVVEQVEETTDGATDPDEDNPLEMDEKTLRERYGQQFDVPREYLEAEDGDPENPSWIVVIRARPLEGTTDVQFTQHLVSRVQSLLDKNKSSAVQAQIVGHFAKRNAQVSTMKQEVLHSTGYALLLLLLVLGIHFKRIRAIPLVLFPLIVGILGTVGISTLMFPWLNVVTAFIFVALLGLGIDFGIHLLARYEFERLDGAEQHQALLTANTHTGQDVAMGALTTAILFALLTVSDFRGFSQFGVVASVGVIMTFLCTFTVLPALVVTLERILPWKPRRWLPMVRNTDTESTTRKTARWARPLSWAVLVVSLVLAGFSLWKAPDISFEYDFNNLEQKVVETEEKPKQKGYKDALQRLDLGPAISLGSGPVPIAWLDAQFQGFAEMTDAQMTTFLKRELTSSEKKKNDPESSPPDSALDPCDPSAPIGDTDDEDEDDEDDEDEDDDFFALELDHCFFRRLERANNGHNLSPASRRLLTQYADAPDRLASMRRYRHKHLSPWSFVPSRQWTKLWLIRDMRREIDKKYAELTDESQEKITEFRQQLAVEKPVGLEDLPTWLTDKWTDTKNNVGHHAIVYNRGSKMKYWVSKEIYNAFFDIPVRSAEALDSEFLGSEPAGLQWKAATAPYADSMTITQVVAFVHNLLARGIPWSPQLVATLSKHVSVRLSKAPDSPCHTNDRAYRPWNLENCAAPMKAGSPFDSQAFLKDLEQALDSATQEQAPVPVAASYFVMPNIIDTLMQDSPKVVSLGLLAIFLCLMFFFRKVTVVFLVLVPVIAAISWLAGVFWLLEWKVNLYNIITFALLVGMGVDDGIHVTSRWLENGRRHVRTVLRETGTAIGLTTLTTCIGFGGLVLSNHMGLSTLGSTAALGMVLTFAASVTTLPALLVLFSVKEDNA